MAAAEEFAVGQRVATVAGSGGGRGAAAEGRAAAETEPQRATVRFVGPVPPTKGVWVGVEWDDPSRGRHDGCHEGTRYFDCESREPTAASFVRPNKITAGVTLEAALKARYSADRSEQEDDMVLVDDRNQNIAVTMVGSDKVGAIQSDLQRLREAYFSGMSICAAGASLGTTAPGITHLDLSRTLVASWTVLAGIARQLPLLQSLRFSDNVLAEPDTAAEAACAGAFPQLRELFLNKCRHVALGSLAGVAAHMPALQELHLVGNNICRLDVGDSGQAYAGLRLLNLQQNDVASWAEVARLAALKQLETLILTENRALGDTETGLGAGVELAALTALTLSGCQIAQWSTLAALEQAMPRLEAIRIRDVPLLAGEKRLDARQLLVARMPNLRVVNGSAVGELERTVAERFYLARYAELWFDASRADELARTHPRYRALVEVHGEPPKPQAAVSVLKDSLLALTICGDNGAELALEVPPGMVLRQLKRLIQRKRVFGIPAAKQQLHYREAGGVEAELDDDTRELSWFGIESGSTILVRST